MPFKAYYLSSQGDLRVGLNEDECRTASLSKEGLLWVDICGITKEDGELLQRVFNFHHLAVEDCRSALIHPPKIDDFGEYLFIIIHGINHVSESYVVETAELAVFLCHHFVVSSHRFPLHSVESIKRLVEDDGRPMRRGAEFLVHALLDALIDDILPTIDVMGERIDEVEEEVIRAPNQVTLEVILHLKRSALRLHRVMAPQREILNRLSRGEFPIIREEVQIFYRDIYDHIFRIEDLNQSVQDRATDALATYLSSVANRQNETMRILSMVATIFMPLTLIAGIYGMNFESMPELRWPWGYFAVLGLMGTISAVTILWFFMKGWIKWGGRREDRVRPFVVEPEKLIGHDESQAELPRY